MGLIAEIERLLANFGLHPTIQRYPNCSAHVRLWRMNEIESFCREAMKFSHGNKLAQLSIFMNELVPIFHVRSSIGKQKKTWNRSLFLQAIGFVDEINRFKRSRRTARKYTRQYFESLWGSN